MESRKKPPEPVYDFWSSGIPPEEESSQEEPEEFLEELSPRLRRIVMLRFGFLDDRPRTLKEIGQELGVSKERVRQLEQRALEKLRSSRTPAPVLDPLPQNAPAGL